MAQQRQSPNPKPRKPLTAERLRELLCYDPETGEWGWLKQPRSNRGKPGSKAGSLNKHLGYVYIGIDGRSYQSSRLAFLYMTGEWPTLDVDHRDGNPGNDSWANLRPASRSQNIGNSRLHRGSSSGFKGVTWHKQRRKWKAQIKLHGRNIHLGHFDTPEAAYEEYCRKARELFGEYARFE
jgi:hypothetical protein